MAVYVPGLIAIIVFYLLILGVGLWAARKTGLKQDSVNSDNVILAGRSIGLLVGCFTMTATWVGGGFINGSSEIIVSSGLVWCQAPVGYGLSLLFGGYFFAEKMRARKFTTMLDPFQQKYGELMGALLYLPALLGEVFWSAAILSALGASLAVILELDTKISIIISACISLLYTILGGLYSVAYTDVVQLICIFIGLWVSVPFAMTNSAVSSITENSTSTWIGEVATTDIGIYMDSFLLLIFGGIPWQVYFQRVLSASSVSVARSLSFVAAFGCVFMAIPAVLIGAVASNTDWNQTNYAGADGSSIGSDNVSLTLPLVLRYLTPDAVAVVGLGAVSAAVMSSTDSSLLAASSMFARNVYGVIYTRITKTKPSERMTVWTIRITQVVLAALACAMAITVSSIYYLWYLSSDFVFVVLFPQLVCVLYLRGTNTYGSLSGFILGLLFRLLGGESGIGLPVGVHYPWYSVEGGQRFPFRTLAMLITFAAIIGVSYPMKYLFENEILPMEADIFRCFSDDSALQSYPPYDKPCDIGVVNVSDNGKDNRAYQGKDNTAFQGDPEFKFVDLGKPHTKYESVAGTEESLSTRL